MRTVCALVCTLMLVGGAAAEESQQTLKYTVVRKGEQIGTHTVEIRRKDAETTVNIATQVTVKIAFVTAYSFQQTDTERWVNGRLASLRATTDNNGTKSTVEVTAANQGLRIQGAGKSLNAPADTMPASLWNPALMKQTAAINTVDGSIMPIKVTSKGVEELATQSGRTKAHRFNMQGVFDQELWYDEQGRLVQLKLKGSDGSDVFYKLVEPTPDARAPARPS